MCRATNTFAFAINDHLQIVGQADVHGFLREPDGTFVMIVPPGSQLTNAQDINNPGQIVGLFGDATGFHGFLRETDGTFNTIDVPGASVTHALGINAAGQIVGLFQIQGEMLGDRPVTHGFLATPIPEPATWLMLGSGLISFLIWRRYAYT